MNSDIDSASDNRDIEWFKDTVLEIWNRLPVPEGDIAPFAEPGECEPQWFYGKHFTEVPMDEPLVFNRMPLIWFAPYAGFYYAGSYLLDLVRYGDKSWKWTLGIDHAISHLRRVLDCPKTKAMVNATDPRLPLLLNWCETRELE